MSTHVCVCIFFFGFLYIFAIIWTFMAHAKWAYKKDKKVNKKIKRSYFYIVLRVGKYDQELAYSYYDDDGVMYIVTGLLVTLEKFKNLEPKRH